MAAFDVIVVGAGVVGSAAAYHAAKAGQRVLLLEQFDLDHQMGSSYGASRIIRYAYDHPAYVELAKAAYPLWAATQAEAGEELFVLSGGIDIGYPDEASFRAVSAALDAARVAYERLDARQTSRRFPQFRLDDDMESIFQVDAGVLRASRCVLAQVRLARRHGATVLDRVPVGGIRVYADSAEVQTTEGFFSAARLVLAPGAWGKAVFGMVGLDLPLQPVAAQEQYFDAAPRADYEPRRFPTFIAHLQDRYGMMPYGLPSVDGSGLKVGLHGGPPVTDLGFERVPRPEAVSATRAFLARHVPGGDAPLRHARVCLYTMTPDEHFVVDRHPAHPHVLVSASCSGHGFKFGSLLGRILTDLALTGETAHDIGLFRLSRFGDVARA